MVSYEPPVDDARFLLRAFDYPRIASLDAFRDYDLETVILVLEQFGQFFHDEVVPTNAIGDRRGCEFDPHTNRVTTPSQFREAWSQLAQKGYHGTVLPRSYGGSGGPYVLGTLLDELFMAANKSLAMFGELSSGLALTLLQKGTEAQKNRYIPKLADGTCGATMAMTEPQCGSDVSLIRTRAESTGDNGYTITGSKRWITGGDHDLTDNILHLVLAKRPDSQSAPGDGLAPFLVPKYLPDGRRNGVTCTGLEDKLGIHGSPTCEMHFDAADGWLVGDLDKGMSTMFVMMGEIRRKVALEGIALSEIAYQVARDWAHQRRQGRSLDPNKRDDDHDADPLLVHPDVRRMLAEIKASTEGMRGLAIWTALQADVARHHPRAEVRDEAQNLVELVTPILKAYCTERGFANVNKALQITGGAGYTRDLPIEQYLRDLRIGSVYEGTNYIQALDLVGRKLSSFPVFASRIQTFLDSTRERADLANLLDPFEHGWTQLQELTDHLKDLTLQDREVLGAVALNYLKHFALTLLGYTWCCQVKYAVDNNSPQKDAKYKTARYFFDMVFSEVDVLATKVKRGKEPMMAFDVDEF